ncbi:MAG: cobalamin B12-binding domain-containing protein [Dethiobacteria bacterium]|jgi:dimethylamine corrinoid protein
MIDYNKLVTAMKELEGDTVIEMLNELMAAGGADADKAMAACQEGMGLVGDLFESGEYFVGDLVYAGELMAQAMDIIRPALASDSTEKLGQMILCTVEGDLHDIGKNIVKAMMEAGGFEVIDLGIDVSPAKIVETAKENNIKIIGLSGILTLAIDSMKATVGALKDAGMREDVHIIIGGNPITAEVCESVGADAWSVNPQEGVKICRNWAGAK